MSLDACSTVSRSGGGLAEPRSGSYGLRLGNRLAWKLVPGTGTRDWLDCMAALMGLEPEHGTEDYTITFEEAPTGWAAWRTWLSRPPAAPRASGNDLLHAGGWTLQDFRSVRLWSHSALTGLICELLPSRPRHYQQDVLLMWGAMHAIYHGLCAGGGCPLHSALLEADGLGVLLVGSEGAGKSTASRRVRHPWKALSDDLVLVAPGAGGVYIAHPVPTWSSHVAMKPERAVKVDQGVCLRAVFFLERGLFDEVWPVGRGQAAVMLTKTADYVCCHNWRRPERSSLTSLRRSLFDNVCKLVDQVPCFVLTATLDGRFWENIERVL